MTDRSQTGSSTGDGTDSGARSTLGVYVDDVYTVVAGSSPQLISSDRSFMTFAAEVARPFGGLTVFGRTLRADDPADHPLPPGTRLVVLPLYDELTRLGQVARATPGTARAMWRGLAGTDVVWIFGPHPFGLLLAALARLRGRRIVLGVRQDTLSYYRSRLRSRAWKPALALTWLLDRAYRLLARRTPITVVGDELTQRYGAGRTTVKSMTVTLVRAADIAPAPSSRSWDGPIELLTVGRLEQEKNPFLVIDVLELLEQRDPGRYRLTWAGRGPLETELASRAAEAGLADRIRLTGYVPMGEPLLALYRDANAFVHVSLTEGVPQVLLEAFACGVPVVATAVGGVPAAVEHGAAAILVPPNDAAAIVTAVIELTDAPNTRLRIASRGLELAQQLTLEAEAERVARFVAGEPEARR